MASILPNIQTTVKLALGALFTTVVLVVIGVSGWMFTNVKANETEIETVKTDFNHLRNGQIDIQKDIDTLIEHINILNKSFTDFKLDTNSEISDNRLETTKSSLTTEHNIEIIQNDVRFLQTNFTNLQNSILPILNWVSQQQVNQQQVSQK